MVTSSNAAVVSCCTALLPPLQPGQGSMRIALVCFFAQPLIVGNVLQRNGGPTCKHVQHGETISQVMPHTTLHRKCGLRSCEPSRTAVSRILPALLIVSCIAHNEHGMSDEPRRADKSATAAVLEVSTCAPPPPLSFAPSHHPLALTLYSFPSLLHLCSRNHLDNAWNCRSSLHQTRQYNDQLNRWTAPRTPCFLLLVPPPTNLPLSPHVNSVCNLHSPPPAPSPLTSSPTIAHPALKKKENSTNPLLLPPTCFC